jgi:hypothetical protein
VSTKTEKPDPDTCSGHPYSKPHPHPRQPKLEPVSLDFIKSEATVSTLSDSGGDDRFIKPELLGDAAGLPPAPGAAAVAGSFGSTACSGCGYSIHEEFILKVGEKSWHSQCLREGVHTTVDFHHLPQMICLGIDTDILMRSCCFLVKIFEKFE